MDHRILNHDTYDFSQSTIIKPHEISVDDVKKTVIKYTRIVIDSRDRNTNLYPNPASYTIYLEESIEDIIIAELLVAKVPFNEHLINKCNDLFQIQVSGLYNILIGITNKNYSEQELAIEIQEKLNSHPISQANGYTFYVLYGVDSKFRFISNTPFQIISSDSVEFDFNGNEVNKYMKNSAFKLLGFGKNTYSSVETIPGSNEITSPFVRNFTDSEYISLHIDQFSVNKSISNSTNKSFGILSKNITTLSYISSAAFIKKYFPQPIASLSKLTIKFLDPDGNLYDFQNKDHRLEILLQSYKHSRGYNSYIVGT